MTSTKESIDILKRAQAIDRELYLANRETTQDIPEARQKIQAGLEAEKEHLRQLEADLKKLQMKQKEKEGEMAQKEANVKKFEGQLSQVKTNKEYSALQQEIASMKADGSVLEEEIIKIMDQTEAAGEEVKKERERLKVVEKEYQAKDAEMDQKSKALNDKMETLRKERAAIVEQVQPEARTLYDLIIQKKQGMALAKINGEICGACQLQLRPQLINDVRMAQTLTVCENCSRILYVEE